MRTRPVVHALFVQLLVLTAAHLAPALAHASAPWYDSNWQFRKLITVDPDSISGGGAFTDFPLLVTFDSASAPDVFAGAKPDGSDLLVTTSNGTTVVSREIVGFDPIAGNAELWLKVPSLSTIDNQFYIYYGNPLAALDPQPIDAWSAAYRAVYHFDDDPGAGLLTDSSPQGANAGLVAARNWTSSDVAPAQIGQGWLFNGSTHHISTKSVTCSDSSYVISAWLEHVTNDVDFAFQSNPGFWHISSQVNGQHNMPDLAGGGISVRWQPRPLPINTGYHQFLWVFDGVADTVIFYFDGVPQPIQTTFPLGLTTLYTGRPINPNGAEPVGILGPMFYNSSDNMTGGADEFRLRQGALGFDWIKTEYRNQKSPSSFVSLGPEEVFGATSTDPATLPSVVSMYSYPNPFRSQTSIRFRTQEAGNVRLAVYDVMGRRIRVLRDERLPAGTHSAIWNRQVEGGGTAALGVYFLKLSTPRATRTQKLVLVP